MHQISFYHLAKAFFHLISMVAWIQWVLEIFRSRTCGTFEEKSVIASPKFLLDPYDTEHSLYKHSSVFVFQFLKWTHLPLFFALSFSFKINLAVIPETSIETKQNSAISTFLRLTFSQTVSKKERNPIHPNLSSGDSKTLYGMKIKIVNEKISFSKKNLLFEESAISLVLDFFFSWVIRWFNFVTMVDVLKLLLYLERTRGSNSSQARKVNSDVWWTCFYQQHSLFCWAYSMSFPTNCSDQKKCMILLWCFKTWSVYTSCKFPWKKLTIQSLRKSMIFLGHFEGYYFILVLKVMKCLQTRQILCAHCPEVSNISILQVRKHLREFFCCLKSIVSDHLFKQVTPVISDQTE